MCCCKGGALFVALRCLPMRRGLACGVGAPDGSLCSGCDLGGWGPGYIMPGSDSPRFVAELARHDMSGTSRVAQRCYPASFFSHVIRHIVLPIPPYVADEPTYARSVHENLQGLEDRTLPWWCSLHQAEAPPRLGPLSSRPLLFVPFLFWLAVDSGFPRHLKRVCGIRGPRQGVATFFRTRPTAGIPIQA